MSAWRIGASQQQTVHDRLALDGGSPTSKQEAADLVQKAADVWTKWIPGDVIAIYLGLTTAFRGTLDRTGEAALTPHAWGILVAGLLFAAGLSLLGSVSGNLKKATRAERFTVREIAVRAVLAVVAFGFWSLGVPGSYWEINDWNGGVLAAIAFASSIVFAFVAEIGLALVAPSPTS